MTNRNQSLSLYVYHATLFVWCAFFFLLLMTRFSEYFTHLLIVHELFSQFLDYSISGTKRILHKKIPILCTSRARLEQAVASGP